MKLGNFWSTKQIHHSELVVVANGWYYELWAKLVPTDISLSVSCLNKGVLDTGALWEAFMILSGVLPLKVCSFLLCQSTNFRDSWSVYWNTWDYSCLIITNLFVWCLLAKVLFLKCVELGSMLYIFCSFNCSVTVSLMWNEAWFCRYLVNNNKLRE